MCLGHICNHPHGQDHGQENYIHKNTKQNKTVLAVRMVADMTETGKEPSIKDVRSQGGGGLSIADKGGSSDADVRTFLRKKLRIFRNLWCVRTDRGGEREGLIQCGQGG